MMRRVESLIPFRFALGAMRGGTPFMTLAEAFRSAVVIVAIVVLTACSRDVLTVQVGGVALNVTSAGSVAAIDSWRVTIKGPGGAQTRTGTPGASIQFAELQPGAYSVLLEGLEGADVASRGQTNVTVQAGSTATASVELSAVLPTLTVIAADAAASEVGPDPGSFTITRAGSSSAPVLVNLSMAGTATATTDYQVISPTVTIPAGERSVSFSVLPLFDAEQETAETVVVALASGTGYVVGTPASASVSIADAPLASVTVTTLDAEASEVSPNTGTYRIARTGATTTELAIGVTLSGSAVNGTDYQTIATPQTIRAGAAFVDVVLTPLPDAVVDAAETAVLTVIAGTGYVVGAPETATVTIADNPLPIVSVTVLDAAASEVGLDLGSYRIARTGATTAPLAVGVALSGSALNGADYQIIATTQTIPAGAAFLDVIVRPLADVLTEGVEAAVMTVQAGAGYAVGSPSAASVLIADAPTPTILLTPSEVALSVVEGAASPGTQVSVFNAVAGTILNGLSVGTITYGAGASEWLTASLSSTTAFTTLALQTSTSALAAGTYTATVPVLSPAASNSGQSVTVTLTVRSPGVLYALTSTGSLSTLKPYTGAVLTQRSLGSGLADLFSLCDDGTSLFTIDYIANGQTRDFLYQIFPSTGTGTIVGPILADGTSWRSCDVDATSGVIYAVLNGSSVGLYTISRTTGSATLVASIPGPPGQFFNLTALAINATGEAFVTDRDVNSAGIGLYRISLSTGALTLVGRADVGNVVYSDLAFDATGQLWGFVNNPGSGRSAGLYRISTFTGSATFVSASSGWTGIAFRR